MLASCGLCDDDHGCAAEPEPIQGEPTDFTLHEAAPEHVVVREPRVCEDAYLEIYAIDILIGGGDEVISDASWMVDELRPRLSEQGISTGWGLTDCDGSTISLMVNDWRDAQAIGTSAIALAAEQDVTVALHVVVEERPVYCADEHDACGV